jgi:hypothetical protein
VGHRIDRWTGGAFSTRSQTPLTISGFLGVKTRIIFIRIHDIVKSEVSTEREVSENSNLVSASEVWQIGFRESRERVA